MIDKKILLLRILNLNDTINDTINNITNNTNNYNDNNINNDNYNITKYCKNNEEITEANISLEILLMMLLLCISIGGGHLLKKSKIKIINEPLFATIIGAIAGAILNALENNTYINNITNFYVKFFLIVLLPPIIFER